MFNQYEYGVPWMRPVATSRAQTPVTAMRAYRVLWLSLAFLALGLAVAHTAAAADGFTVIAEPRGAAVAVDVRATVTAPHAVIWSTMTDYAHMAEFVPGMHSSKVTERYGSTAIVEQRGDAGFLIFSYGIDVIVASTEYYPDNIEIRVLKGNLKRLDGRYQIERGAVEGAWVVRWVGFIEPSLPLPQFLNVRLIRSSITDQFRGLLNEIERRDTARRTAMLKGN
jgi:ribosome-associated toxin RatA of RatAB toxin-antitoxin module